MSSHSITHPGAVPLYAFGRLLFLSARGLVAAARSLDAWLVMRQRAADARRDLGAMSDRELRDIGLTRSDVEYVANGGTRRTPQ